MSEDRAFSLDLETPPGEEPAKDTVVSLSRQPRDAATKEGVKKQKTQAEHEFETKAKVWRAMLADPAGRKELWTYLNGACQVFEAPFQQTPIGFPDPQATFYKMGGQRVGRILLDMLEVIDPQGVWLMRSEHDPIYQSRPKVD